MPENVKTLCQSSRSFVKKVLAEARADAGEVRIVKIHTVQNVGGARIFREIDRRRRGRCGSGSARTVEVRGDGAIRVHVQEARDQLAGGA